MLHEFVFLLQGNGKCIRIRIYDIWWSVTAASRSAPRMERMRRVCCAHAHCLGRVVVGLLAYRANRAVGETRREGRRPTHCKQKDIGDFKYPLLILELSIIPPCVRGKKDTSNKSATWISQCTGQIKVRFAWGAFLSETVNRRNLAANSSLRCCLWQWSCRITDNVGWTAMERRWTRLLRSETPLCTFWNSPLLKRRR